MKLVLEDGSELTGELFASSNATVGEVVFNTGMTGYVEILTDPSYKGQILVLTYPLVGNYGVPQKRPRGDIKNNYESDHIQVAGLIVQNHIDEFSHHSAERSLAQWLSDENVPAISGINTRELTQKLRETGTMKGWLVPEGMSLQDAQQSCNEIHMPEVFDHVSPTEVKQYPAGDLNILLIDIGAKDNIVRNLNSRGASVIRAGWKVDLNKLSQQVDGIMIGNGPGDPKDLKPLIDQTRQLMSHYKKPIFGICLGHQVLSLAAGADTYKLKYGHRGVNQPVLDKTSQRCYITSQNHGYAVCGDSIPDGWESWFVNLNDETNEGIRSLTAPIFSVQFHPEAAPGPKDTRFLFDDFLQQVVAIKMAEKNKNS